MPKAQKNRLVIVCYQLKPLLCTIKN